MIPVNKLRASTELGLSRRVDRKAAFFNPIIGHTGLLKEAKSIARKE
jgi:hypothetical protein